MVPCEESQSFYVPCEEPQSFDVPCEEPQSLNFPCEEPQSFYVPCEESQSLYVPCEEPQSLYVPCEEPQALYILFITSDVRAVGQESLGWEGRDFLGTGSRQEVFHMVAPSYFLPYFLFCFIHL